MGPLEFTLLSIGAVIAWRVFQFSSTRVPKARKRDITAFQRNLPEGFVYPCYLDGMGYGINVPEEKSHLLDGKTHKIHGRNDIREIRRDSGKYETQRLTWGKNLAGLVNRIDVAVQNRKSRQKAFKSPGSFISVTDIDHPMLQIKVSDNQNAVRCHEIIRQFMHGELKPYDEHLKAK